jgi:hypothetical protein
MAALSRLRNERYCLANRNIGRADREFWRAAERTQMSLRAHDGAAVSQTAEAGVFRRLG